MLSAMQLFKKEKTNMNDKHESGISPQSAAQKNVSIMARHSLFKPLSKTSTALVAYLDYDVDQSLRTIIYWTRTLRLQRLQSNWVSLPFCIYIVINKIIQKCISLKIVVLNFLSIRSILSYISVLSCLLLFLFKS